ncbi:MAG: RelA/SpoT domain-containing protein [Alphaproteobacteria bacterium]|nr:RelA/SpoT domain-containing protein [Alphaproteobacteria bacterium]
MEWAKPQYTRNQVDRAGTVIIKPLPVDWTTPEWREAFAAYRHAVEVVNNWRSAHSYPLNCFQTNLRTRARKTSQQPLVSQRLKRFESIHNKLSRKQTETMQLSQMQDIGGCRAVLPSCREVYELAESYRSSTRKFAQDLVGDGKDYIATPKPDGYRSLHLIYRWIGPNNNKSWDKLRIEIQIRSLNQHAWATALETVDILTKQALKANQGDEEWKRFFLLMSSVIAIGEKCPLVPGTPGEIRHLRQELSDLSRNLDVVHVL